MELFDDRLGKDLPAGYVISTEPVWEGGAPTLRGQLDEMAAYARSFYSGNLFPLFLGGEHGILPPLIHAARHHPAVEGDLSNLTIVQLDAHADLRSSLDGEIFPMLVQLHEALMSGLAVCFKPVFVLTAKKNSSASTPTIASRPRLQNTRSTPTAVARRGKHGLRAPFAFGPVHFTLDIDGLDGALVPATGTPVPGGLSFGRLWKR